MSEKLSLYQKLLEIEKIILGLGKDKAATNYKYVTGDKVLGHVKPLMVQHGLLLKQEILSIENTRQDYIVGANSANQRTKSEILSKVMMRFTWVDCATGDKDENLFGANGQSDWDKGIGSALTYAERYFLLKYFHIPTDEDDIDNPDRKPEEPQVKVIAEPTTQQKVNGMLKVSELLPDTEAWTGAIAYLNTVDASIAKIKGKYSITPANEQRLLTEAKNA